MPKGKSNILEALEELSKSDIYSLILFTLYKIKDIPEYSTLTELAYILDGKNLVKILDYYGGMTIRIPTKQEFKNVVSALLLYQYVNIEGIEYAKAIKELDEEENIKEIKDIYSQVNDIIKNYEFKRN